MINWRTELAASAWEVTPWPRPAVAFRGLYVDLEEPLAARLTAQTTSGHRALNMSATQRAEPVLQAGK
jgi:hypothetical protein